MLVGLGFVRYADLGSTETRGDLVPVDMVSNSIIIGTVYAANKNKLTLMHSNTSHANQISWYKYLNTLNEFYHVQPLEQTFRKPYFSVTKSEKENDVYLPLYPLDKTVLLERPPCKIASEIRPDNAEPRLNKESSEVSENE